MAYAEKTTVPVSKTRFEIEELIKKHGAGQFISGFSENKVMIGFSLEGRQVKFIVEIPSGKNQRDTEQLERQRWRALLLMLKAKFEAIESGISCFDDEFLAYIVLPDGSTVGQWIHPQLSAVYESGNMPPMLPMLE